MIIISISTDGINIDNLKAKVKQNDLSTASEFYYTSSHSYV